MVATSYVDTATGVRGIGARTTSAGAAATDFTAEEDRLINALLTEGAITTNAFKVNASSGMVVTVGSGAAKTDLYAVAGDVAGQGVYVVRLDAATVNVTVPAADPALARTDEVYLIVADAAYDAGSVSLPRIGYRAGTAGGGAPGPDAAWKASVKLATIAVGAAVSSISAGNITDQRAQATLSEWPWRVVGAGGEPAFSSGVSNSGLGYQALQFKKVGNEVRIRGAVTGPTGLNDIFVLPTGYRPPAVIDVPVATEPAVAASGQVLTDGTVRYNQSGGTHVLFSTQFWID